MYPLPLEPAVGDPPFADSPATVTALLRGNVQLAVLPAGSVVPLSREGKLLAVTSPQRSPQLPDLPALREAGIASVEADAWVGLIAPAGTPVPVLDRTHKETVAVLAKPEVARRSSPAGGIRADQVEFGLVAKAT